MVLLCKSNKTPKTPPPPAKAALPRTNRSWISPRQEDGGHSSRQQAKFKRSHPETSESSSQESSSDQEDTGIGRVSLHSPMARARGISPKQGASRSSRASSDLNNIPSTSTAPTPGPSHALGPPRPGLPSVRPNAMKNRQKQLETLRRYEAKIKEQMKPSPSPGSHGPGASCDNTQSSKAQLPMYIHLLDVSKALEHKSVTWLPIADYPLYEAPEETIFYSLVHGRGELILFGGIQTDLNSMQRGLTFSGNSQVVKNTTHFLKAVKSLS